MNSLIKICKNDFCKKLISTTVNLESIILYNFKDAVLSEESPVSVPYQTLFFLSTVFFKIASRMLSRII